LGDAVQRPLRFAVGDSGELRQSVEKRRTFVSLADSAFGWTLAALANPRQADGKKEVILAILISPLDGSDSQRRLRTFFCRTVFFWLGNNRPQAVNEPLFPFLISPRPRQVALMSRYDKYPNDNEVNIFTFINVRKAGRPWRKKDMRWPRMGSLSDATGSRSSQVALLKMASFAACEPPRDFANHSRERLSAPHEELGRLAGESALSEKRAK